ncbi:methyltransferase family protein [Paenarthrobacter sp. NPDC089989]|uniref:methyltransferase family protein n=1 Tax=unclassified Paenarthrobacter TaxID=2634190 RepID=UPI0038301A4A
MGLVSFVCWVALGLAMVLAEVRLGNRKDVNPTPQAKSMDFLMILGTGFALIGPGILGSIRAQGSDAPSFVAGLVLGFMGLLLRIVAMYQLGNRYTLTPQDQSGDSGVMKDGLYAVVRHPGYSGILTQLAGMAIIAADWWGAVCLLPLCLLTIARIHGEEHLLVREFAAQYQRYQKSVRWRLVPWIF